MHLYKRFDIVFVNNKNKKNMNYTNYREQKNCSHYTKMMIVESSKNI